jgi:hypothetical protein
MRGAGRGKSSRTDKQKGLKSIWMTGFKPFLNQMKFVIVLFDFYLAPLTTIGPVKDLTWTFNRVKVTTIDFILFDTLKPCLTNSLTVRLRA